MAAGRGSLGISGMAEAWEDHGKSIVATETDLTVLAYCVWAIGRLKNCEHIAIGPLSGVGHSLVLV